MQLPKRPGEGCLAALIRAGHDKDALLVLQLKIVADDRGVFTNELIGQGRIENVVSRNLLTFIADLRVTEVQPGTSKYADIVEIGNVKLDLAVKHADRFIQVLGVFRALLVKR